MIPELHRVCYAARSMYYIVNIYTLKSNYFAYFHSYNKVWNNLGDNSFNSKRIFPLQTIIIRIMTSA
jgi:hypothetical protein